MNRMSRSALVIGIDLVVKEGMLFPRLIAAYQRRTEPAGRSSGTFGLSTCLV